MSELLAGLGSQAIIYPSQEAMRVTTFTKYNDLRSPRSPRPVTPMTPHFTHDTVAEKSRKQIDLDVLRLEEQIRNLKSQRNGLAPVATLPPEMLAKIFSYRVLDDASGITPLNWIKVTHVSRHWRSVALDTPSLWSNIIFNHPKWAEEMLRRSKSAGLTIKSGVGMSTPRMRSIVEQALRQASRIYHLELSGGHGVVERVLTDLEFEGPMLRSLVLSGSANHYYYESDNIAVPEKVLQCEMPYLRHVQLTRCKVNWEAQHLSNLQELQLRQLPESSRPTMEQVVGMLSRMPTLQVLNLTDALPNVVSALSSPDIDHTMEFPALTQLSLSGRVQACTALLRRISIPPQAAVNLQCTAISPTTTDSFSGIIDFVSAHQNAKGAKPIRMLHITNRGYNSLQMHAWPKVYPKYGPIPMPDANLQLELNWSGASVTLEANIHDTIITSFAHAVSLGHLKVLKSFGTFNPLSLEVWRDGFGLLPKLQQITVQGRSASSLIPALIAERTETLSPTSPTTPRSSDLLSVRRPGLRRRKSTVPAVYFPALRKLELDGVSFDDFFLHESEHRDFLDVFLDVLMERCERKAEIQNLVISDCTRVDHDVVESIEDIVVDVEWDGIIMGYTDEEEEDEEEYSDDYWGYAGYNDYDDFSDDYPF